jgi:phosphomannomutase
MKKTILLFDVDGTLAYSGCSLDESMIEALKRLVARGYELGIVGGGTYEKIHHQLGSVQKYFEHIFSECGCVHHDRSGALLSRRDLRQHPLYPAVDILLKKALAFLSTVDYPLTGHLIDRRSGIVYLSLIGMSASEEERQMFLQSNAKHHYIDRLITLLQSHCPPGLDVVRGGSVGIAIYPTEWDKVQVLDFYAASDAEIHYFGDKYKIGGNDYRLLHHPRVIGHPVDSSNHTLDFLCSM